MIIKLKKPNWRYIISFSIFNFLCFVATLAGIKSGEFISTQDFIVILLLNLFVVVFLNSYLAEDVIEKSEEDLLRRSIEHTQYLIERKDWRAFYAVDLNSEPQDMHGLYLDEYETEEDYFQELIDSGYMRTSICQTPPNLIIVRKSK